MTDIHVEPLSGAMGAEIHGLDLSRPLDAASRGVVMDAFRDHLAIFVTDQQIDPGQMTAFVSAFGTPLEHPYLKPVPGHPFVHELRKMPDETINFGNVWHTDFTNLPRPSLANALYARMVPSHGGDTLFINMYGAFEALSPRLQDLLSGLNAVHGYSEKYKQDLKDQDEREGVTRTTLPRQGDEILLDDEVLHPVVRRHPETGRRALYVNEGFTLRFEGMTVEESRPLLDFLYRHCQRPEFTSRYRWRADTLGVWDNRYTMHYALNDYHGQLRIMHRMVVLEPEKPPLAGGT